ncbi:hypothetical protein CAEBREN_10038 [Caenorhabditis brenneri]|uniref:Uncharacterized protein n=1 Tax=Caenorhabditis brenneri TaxID=135651 RepID=G0N9J8_CAEBE|nr:hypothetical protein CAEBREN_10038 [Caenorhabditis brenneri]
MDENSVSHRSATPRRKKNTNKLITVLKAHHKLFL